MLVGNSKIGRTPYACLSPPLPLHQAALARCGQTSASHVPVHQHNCKLMCDVVYFKAHFMYILMTYQPGVRGAFSSLNSFIYCGAGVNGPCAAGVPNTIRNGVESMDITRI